MAGFFSALIAKLVAITRFFADLFVSVFKAAWDFFQDAVCWVLDEFLKLSNTAIRSLDLTGITSVLASVPVLPSDVLNVLSLLGVGQAITIISAAILVRLSLQLIPFVRLGS